jgi:hypothetical protein
MVESLRTSGAGSSDGGSARDRFARPMWKHFSIDTYPDATVADQRAKAIPFVMLRSTACWSSCAAAD